jgi:hypothetical protein
VPLQPKEADATMATFPERRDGATTFVCVTGMHRSGTSLATRTLELLGVSLGHPDGLLAPGPDNPAGYWENQTIKELDDLVLATLGGSWDKPPTLPDGWELDPALDGHRKEAHDALVQAFGPGPLGGPVGFKDPRASLLLPFWRTVVDVTTTVVVVRDPVEVVHSLHVRNDMTTAQAALLWIRYLLAATTDDPGHLLVVHETFFDDRLPSTLQAMARHLGLPDPTPAVVEQAAQHVDPQLRHHRTPPRPGRSDPPLVHIAEALWNDGDVAVDVLPDHVRLALAQGWLRDPGDDDLLAAARAEVVALTEEIRRRNRERDAQLSTRVRRRVRSARRWVESRARR